MTKTFDKQDLGKVFDMAIRDALLEGFNICPNELTGSYGIAADPVVFAKGRERIVMWIERNRNREDVTLKAYVSRFELKKGERIEWQYNWDRQWKEHVVSEADIYDVSRYGRDEVYTFDKSFYEECKAKRAKRSEMRETPAPKKTIKDTDKLFETVRRIPGFKRIKRENLQVERWAYRSGYLVRNLENGKVLGISANDGRDYRFA